MISYSEYLLEKKLEKLFESNIKFSKGFLGALNSIDTPLSKKIMSLQNNDVDVQYNYIDVAEENDSVSFTPDRKAQEIIAGKEELYRVIDSGRYLTNSERNQHIYDRLNHERPEDVYQPEVGTVGKVLGETTGTTGKIYCLFECTSEGDKGERTIINKEALESYDASFDKVWITSRNKIKIGRVIRALLRASGVQSNDAEIEKFVNQYKSTIDIINDAFNKFDVVKDFDILHWYNYENYTYGSDKGTLGNSCMADVPDSWLYIYRSNPDVCNLVILYDESGKITDGKYKSTKIIGRALLWATRDGYKFMDRIYTAKDSDIDLFKKFADRNGWWTKKSQNSGNSFTIEKGSESKSNSTIIVDLQKWDDEFPYLDSLMYFNNGTGELSNDGDSIKANYMLQSTSGSYDTISDEDY
jgi:hypothetical protein